MNLAEYAAGTLGPLISRVDLTAVKQVPMPFYAAALSNYDPTILWHYTSLQGFQGIIERNAIWATEISYLNDTTEMHNLVHGVNVIIEQLSSNEFPPDHCSYFASLLADFTRNRKAIFVACFSCSENSLPQWRG